MVVGEKSTGGSTYVPASMVGAFEQYWLRGSNEEILAGYARQNLIKTARTARLVIRIMKPVECSKNMM